MGRRTVFFAVVAGAAVALLPSASLPQSQRAKAATLATEKARQFIYQLKDRNTGVNLGTVTLQPIGSVRSRIRVELVKPGELDNRVTLRTGSDCMEPRVADAPHSPILLNPFTGRISETVVALPLNNLSSGNYLVDVQTATARAEALDACAHLIQP